MDVFRILLHIGLFIVVVLADNTLYECPLGWEDNGEYCYRFNQDSVSLSEAKASCRSLGEAAFVLSINSDAEHSFIHNQLTTNYDKGNIKRDWWTSGRRVSDKDDEVMHFYWEGDGRPIESYYYWHNDDIPKDVSKSKIMYNYNGFQWGWILGVGGEKRPFICKISKEDIYYISDTRRAADYGSNETDKAKIPRGPKVVEQPEDLLFEKSVLAMPDDVLTTYASFACFVDAYPPAEYSWYKLRTDVEEKIDPVHDSRYSLVAGRLIIEMASEERGDSGLYWCKARNKYGAVVSNRVLLEFGFIGDFSRDDRSPISVPMHRDASIDCSNPAPTPDNSLVTFEWYKSNNKYNQYVRTELKPNVFISWDGNLYFSEVTKDDEGLYYCKVSRPGFSSSSGAFSPPIMLNITESSAGEYDPNIQSGFPRIYPPNPKVGDDVRIECFAAGSSDPPLIYSWSRREVHEDGTSRAVPLPLTYHLDDHDRVLNIRNVQVYDMGSYACTVERRHGGTDTKERTLHLTARPFFVVELEDQFIDHGSNLRWRCEADGLPQPGYRWLKNGAEVLNETAGTTVSHNVLIITNAKPEMHDGMYQCEAKNVYGTRYSTAELRAIEFAPTFTKQPLQINQFATEEGNATIRCRPEAAPKVTISWYKNGILLRPVEGDRVRQMNNGNLFISPVLQSDTGVYNCTAVNRMGKASSVGNFTVLKTVTITWKPQTPDGGFRVNHSNILHCIASYNPRQDITYVWHQGDMLIEFEKVYRLGENKYFVWNDPHFKRGSGYYLGALYIMDAQYSNNGKYTCTVESTNGGRVSAAVDVIVIGPPSEPAGVYGVSSTTTSVAIQFIPAGDNGAPITSFLIETFNHWEGFWRIHETNIEVGPKDVNGNLQIQRHNVTGLRPFSFYQIRVRAENDIGTSMPSDPSEKIRTTPVVPDLYPDQVGGGGGKTGELLINWKPMKAWEKNGEKFFYRVFYKNEGDREFGDRVVNASSNAMQVSILVGEKNFYMPYDVAVQAFNEKGPGPISPQVTIRSAMRMPDIMAHDVQIQPFNSTACIVSWKPVNVDREKIGGQLGGYRVAYWDRARYGKEVMEDASRVTINGQNDMALVIGLLPDTVYMFGVYVWNEAGNGPITDPFPQRTLRQAPINQPVEVHVYQLTDSSIRVTFRGVSTTNVEEPLIGYKVRIWHGGSAIKIADDYNAKKEIELEIKGLNPEILYKLRVFGYSRGGDGTMSSPAVEFRLGAAGQVHTSVLLILCAVILALTRPSL